MKLALSKVARFGVVSLTSLSFACGSDEADDPLASIAGFCKAWAAAACNDVVVDECGATSADACKTHQSSLCLERLPPTGYRKNGAEACLKAIGNAYRDGELDAKERLTIKLGAPCDKVVSGSGEADDSCRTDLECNSSAGYACLTPLGADRGECQIPKEVGGGENCSAKDAVCTAAFYCDGSTERCFAKLEQDEACSATEPCKESDQLRCIVSAADPAMTTCQAKLGNNEACQDHTDCATGSCEKDDENDASGFCKAGLELSRSIFSSDGLCKDLR